MTTTANTTLATTNSDTTHDDNHHPNNNHQQQHPIMVTLDSLPYIDQIHPDYESYALTLMEEEMQQMPPPPPVTFSYTSIPEFGSNSNSGGGSGSSSSGGSSSTTTTTSINQEEYKQLVARNGQKRNEPVIDSSFPSSLAETLLHQQQEQLQQQQHDESHLIVRKAKIALEHERWRQVNLELYAACASTLWKDHVSFMERNAEYSKGVLQEQLLLVDQINAERKQMQESAARNQLGKLEFQWAELIRKNRYLVKGVEMLEEEVRTMRQ